MSRTFSKPENYDAIKDLSGKGWQVWSGCNDWEDVYPTRVWVDLDGSNGLTRVWMTVALPESAFKGSTKQEDIAALKAQAKKVPALWVATMRKVKAEDEFPSDSSTAAKRYFEAALKHEDMADHVKEHGVDETRWVSKSASTANTVPLTGPEAIAHALDRLDTNELENAMKEIIRTRKTTKRPRAVDVLNTLEGLRRNKMKPGDLLISSVPVVPAQFRPFSVIGDTFTPGDANELYRDLFKVRDAYSEARQELGDEGAREARLHLYDAVKAVYGYRDPVEPKTLQRGVSGFLQKVTGVNPKYSYVSRQLLAKPMDTVGRSVVGIDPDLGMDEVGIPREMAFKMYAPYIQSRLVQGGMSPADAVRAIRDRASAAHNALDREIKVRPCVYSRAPSWHRFSTVAGHPKLVDGDTIMLNPYITAGMNADFDGDAVNAHVPSMDDSVSEAYEKLMPSKMLFSDRNYEMIPSVPKHEAILGIFAANARPADKVHQFPDQASALAAIRKGHVKLNDEVQIPGL